MYSYIHHKNPVIDLHQYNFHTYPKKDQLLH